MNEDRDWVMDVSAAHGSWERKESPSYDLDALKAEYDSRFRKALEESQDTPEDEGSRG